MTTNYFENQETIAKNLIAFMRERGYSRLSLSKIAGIDRQEVDQLLNVQNTDEKVYNSQINQIKQVFELTDDYLLMPIPILTTSLRPSTIVDKEPNELAQELRNGLDNILDVFSSYT